MRLPLFKLALIGGMWIVTGLGPLGVQAETNVTLRAVASMTPSLVNSADETSLRAALKAGGKVVLAFDGVIPLSQTIIITHDTILDGSGHSVTISGQEKVRVFTVSTNVHFKLLNVTVAKGLSENGGGLFNDGGTVEIENCTFTGNRAVGADGTNGPNLAYGSTNNLTGGTGQDSRGGAIYSFGVININDTVFQKNLAQGGHGGTGGNTGERVGVAGGRAGDGGSGGTGMGGAFYLAYGSASLTNCHWMENAATGGDGGDAQEGLVNPGSKLEGGSGGKGGSGFGAGIYNGYASMDLVLCTALGNLSAGGNGGMGKGGKNIWYVWGVGGKGGKGGDGEGGFMVNCGSGKILDCSVSDNRALGGAGGNGGLGIGRGTAGSAGPQGGAGGQGGNGQGGGFLGRGVLTISRSLVSQNMALGGIGGQGGNGCAGSYYADPRRPGQGGLGGDGGNGYGGGGITFSAETIVNTTVFANKAAGGAGGQGGKTGDDYYAGYPGISGGSGGMGKGGGLFQDAGHTDLTHCTYASNSTTGGSGGPGGLGGTCTWFGTIGLTGEMGKPGTGFGGGLCNNTNGGSIKMVNSIVANSPLGGDGAGLVIDGGHNIASDGSLNFTAPGSRNYTDPRLAPLSENGGPTRTLAFLDGSPAIDAGDDAGCPPTDQRGVARPVGPRCDTGAFEGESIALPVMTVAFTPLMIAQGGTSTLRIALSNFNRETNVTGTIRLPSGLAAKDGFVVTNVSGAIILASSIENGNTVVHVDFTAASTTWIDLRITGLSPGAHTVIASLRSPLSGARETVHTASLKVTGAAFVRTDPANADAAQTAVLYGVVNPGGLETTVFFEYGTTTNYNNRTAARSIGSGFSDALVSEPIQSLDHGISYHYRIVAQRGLETIYGGDEAFAPARTVLIANESGLRSAMENGGTIKLACDGVLDIAHTLTIEKDTLLDATGHDVTLSGNDQVRIMLVNPDVKLTLINLRLYRGRSDRGGALYNNRGVVNAIGCVFSNNTAMGTNSLVFAPTNAPDVEPNGGDAQGGAIYNAGWLFVTHGSFLANKACGGAGGGGGTNQYTKLLFPGGDGGHGFGGAIYNAGGQVTILHSRSWDNQATGGAGHSGGDGYYIGGIFTPAGQPGGGGGEGYGGWICSLGGNLFVSQCQIAHNWANGGLGGNGGSVVGMLNERGHDGGPGGCGLGGAIYSRASMSAQATEWADNYVSGGNGGQGTYGFRAPNGVNGAGGASEGGAIYNEGELTTINNSFFANRTQSGSGDATKPSIGSGGGIHNNGGYISCINCTLSANQAAGAIVGGGNLANDLGSVVLINTILANNPSASNVSGAVIDGGHNLSSDATCGFTAFGSANVSDPKLGSLGDNGGFTRTIALLPGSPAIDAADNEASPPTDQRGMPRPYGASSDIGAFELTEVTFPVLRLAAPRFLPDGSLQLSLTGPAGLHYTIEYSDDLATWHTLTDFISTEAIGMIADPAGPNRPRRYYRAFTP
jgi:hypothetical protein